mmetsp:Transcript_66202/g.122197  ORF Transcript_66202/g.122197 Transcript_66202/m.122197 type:complete len:225 (-) Transcript_66202:1367-2041(-)
MVMSASQLLLIGGSVHTAEEELGDFFMPGLGGLMVRKSGTPGAAVKFEKLAASARRSTTSSILKPIVPIPFAPLDRASAELGRFGFDRFTVACPSVCVATLVEILRGGNDLAGRAAGRCGGCAARAALHIRSSPSASFSLARRSSTDSDRPFICAASAGSRFATGPGLSIPSLRSGGCDSASSASLAAGCFVSPASAFGEALIDVLARLRSNSQNSSRKMRNDA